MLYHFLYPSHLHPKLRQSPNLKLQRRSIERLEQIGSFTEYLPQSLQSFSSVFLRPLFLRSSGSFLRSLSLRNVAPPASSPRPVCRPRRSPRRILAPPRNPPPKAARLRRYPGHARVAHLLGVFDRRQGKTPCSFPLSGRGGAGASSPRPAWSPPRLHQAAYGVGTVSAVLGPAPRRASPATLRSRLHPKGVAGEPGAHQAPELSRLGPEASSPVAAPGSATRVASICEKHQ